MSIGLIFLAGGQGQRFNSPTPKQFIKLGSDIMALLSFQTLMKVQSLIECVVVCDSAYSSHFKTPSSIALSFALPGKERQDSVRNGFEKLSTDCKYVLVHDSARPFIKLLDVQRLLQEGIEVGAAALATPITSTIKKTHTNAFVAATIDRSFLWDIQTPQFLTYDLLKEGFSFLKENSSMITDDVSIAELLGAPVKLVQGDPTNIKVTHPHDFHLANYYLTLHQEKANV